MQYRRMLLRAALTLLIVTASTWWTPMTATNYRFYSDCLQSCHDYSVLCAAVCDQDCAILYAGDPSQISACDNLCRDNCEAGTRDCRLAAYYYCKLACAYNDPPPCPQE